jgi:aminocarboxymuconate-semialdehyde decarboxylase
VSEGARLRPSIGDTKPSERIAQLYLDTASYHPVPVKAAIDAVGADHVVLGTDFPPAGRSPQPAVDLVRELGLDPGDRDLILSGNARLLLDAQQAAPAVAT